MKIDVPEMEVQKIQAGELFTLETFFAPAKE